MSVEVSYDGLGQDIIHGLASLDQKIQILSKKFREQQSYQSTLTLTSYQSNYQTSSNSFKSFDNDKPLLEAKIKILEDENKRLVLENEMLNLKFKSEGFESKVSNGIDGTQEKEPSVQLNEKFSEWKKFIEDKEKEVRELREVIARYEITEIDLKKKIITYQKSNSTNQSNNQSTNQTTSTQNNLTSPKASSLPVPLPAKPAERTFEQSPSQVERNKVLRKDTSATKGSSKASPTQSDARFSVAFGTYRGSCVVDGCTCTKYISFTNGKCEKCDHFPALHEDKGKASPRAIPDTEEKVIEKESSATAQPQDKVVESSKSKEAEVESDQEGTVSPTDQLSDDDGGGNPLSPSERRRKLVPKVLPNRDMKAETQEEIRSNLDSDWLVEYPELKFITKMGRGVSSTVWKGTLKEEVVAIKVLRLEQKMQDLRDFKEELFIMSRLRSPYIVHFYGATLEPKLCIVMELCVNGSLCHYLAKPLSEVTWDRVLKWSTEITRGINTLHLWKPPLVHRDLKSLNLLLDRDFSIKVCDFGLSRYTQGEQCDDATLQKLRGTYAYTAPEMYYSKNYTAKSDVYSIGVVIWELVVRLVKNKHCKPYSEYSDIKYDYQIIFQVAQNQRRPTIPPECPTKIKQLIEKCWSQNPDERPTAGELLQILKNIKSKKKTKWYSPTNTPSKTKDK